MRVCNGAARYHFINDFFWPKAALLADDFIHSISSAFRPKAEPGLTCQPISTNDPKEKVTDCFCQ